jgi:hypothetical protein
MATTENTLRYLKTDFQSHKDALLQRVRARWPDNWNDFLSNSFGIVLVDIVAWSTSTLAFLLNRVAAENYISTMTLRESAVRLGSLVGYQLHGPAPATVACEATLTSAQTADVTIPKATLIRTSNADALPFEVSKNYVILAGELTPRTEIAQFSPELSGANVINSFVRVTSGSSSVDLVDSTINLSQFIEAGQSFSKAADSTIYTILSLENAPGAISEFTRIVLDRPYAGATEVTAAEVFDTRIVLVQGQTITDRFVSPTGQSPSFVLKLSRNPVIDNSVVVTVNGAVWTPVSSTAMRGADDQVYQIKTLISGQTLVTFGDDRFGKIIPEEASISVLYRVGGGLDGNIRLNEINTSVTGLVESLSNPVPITVTNSTSTGIGGQNAETLEQARVSIPFFARTNDRAVTLSDYQTLAQQFSDPNYGSVAYARSAIRTENSFLEGNIVVIYAWTTGPDGGLVPLSSALKIALKNYLQTKSVGTDLVEIFDGTARPVPISLRFRSFGGFSIADTARLVRDTIRSFITALRPGDVVEYSNLVRTIDEVTGVDTFNMATPIQDLIPDNSTELFTAPQDDYVYQIQRTSFGSPVTDSNGDAVSQYTAQLPIFPMQVWSFRLFLGSNELTVVPYVTPGFARLLGENLSNDDAYPSTVNLLTGKVALWIQGAPGDTTMKLVSVQGYSTDRPVNVYIGYQGENTLTKRREIRAALRAWSDGMTIGGSMYGKRVSGISASKVSITDVVQAVPNVDFVTRVALDTPANNEDRITSADFELLRLSNIVINNQID